MFDLRLPQRNPLNSIPEKRAGLLFRLTAVVGAVFVITIFALVAAMLGDPEAPPAKFLNRHGTAIIIGEVGLILVIGLLAMTVDRIRILRGLARSDSPQSVETMPSSSESSTP